MSIVETGKLSLFALRQAATIVADAAGDRLGTSIPYDSQIFTSPDCLNRMINAHAVMPLSRPVQITAVLPQDIPSISSNCNNVVVDIEQHGPALLPSSLFIKLPLPALATRWFFSIIGSWQLESRFFRNIAHQVPLRTPQTYATHSDHSRFFLIQENLHQDASLQLFTNPDMITGPSLELARRCLDALARLHAHHFDLSAPQREAILPLALHPFLSPRMRTVSQSLNKFALNPCDRKLPGRIPESVMASYRKTQQHWDELLDYWFSGPLSLLHGDSHLGNFFIAGDEIGMLDFQAVHWGVGIRDVQYFLIDSLPADVLAANEQDLIRYYAERRGHYGAPIEFDSSWQQYRSFSYHTLMTIVVSIGFGALNAEQDVLMEEILKRAVAAVQRLDYSGWLQDFLSS